MAKLSDPGGPPRRTQASSSSSSRVRLVFRLLATRGHATRHQIDITAALPSPRQPPTRLPPYPRPVPSRGGDPCRPEPPASLRLGRPRRVRVLDAALRRRRRRRRSERPPLGSRPSRRTAPPPGTPPTTRYAPGAVSICLSPSSFTPLSTSASIYLLEITSPNPAARQERAARNGTGTGRRCSRSEAIAVAPHYYAPRSCCGILLDGRRANAPLGIEGNLRSLDPTTTCVRAPSAHNHQVAISALQESRGEGSTCSHMLLRYILRDRDSAGLQVAGFVSPIPLSRAPGRRGGWVPSLG